MSDAVLSAVQHIRKMRGGSQPHLMRASDGNYYVVKFQNCPQHIRVLVNEFLATKIALALGLPMPEVAVIEVSDWLIANTPELHIEIAGHLLPCSSGLQLGLRYAGDIWHDHVFDYMPETVSGRVENSRDLIPALVFDKWVGNCDGRQAVFSKPGGGSLYRMTCIDQGSCFNAAEWTFPDRPFHGIYFRKSVYQSISNWDSFEPLLSQVEQFDPSRLWEAATDIPKEWYQEHTNELYHLIEMLLDRRPLVRSLIDNFRNSSENPFPNWSEVKIYL